ncbi:hypothetical protein F2P81_016263 [Scophthalmus maximus]|uniref:TNF receptor-associated factor 2 n=1 Tax=Scophthalmus maximus TaxID=52904 RepID=A0A6A4SHM2_SCOMX|nr:hypothetical protein F2P81_016263 [Scophthalmus maximus]
MTERADGPSGPLCAPEQLPNKDSRGNRPTLKPAEQLSPMLTPSEIETKLESKKSQPSQLSKTNTQYHKLFKEVSKDELLKQSYTCALQKEILYQGKMFVSDNWICFHSRVFGRDTKISIPAMSVTFIKKTKTALLVPNALVIETTSDQHVFVSFLSRNATYKLLRSICIHLEDFSVEYSDLDGVVQQRRQEMMESSSSGSQTPDYDKITDFAGLPDTLVCAVKSGEVSVHADVHLQTPGLKHRAALNNGSAKPTRGVTLKGKSSAPMSLHAILLIYLVLVSVLVLSSCYMAFKIVALEQRLNSLVSMGEHIRNENAVSPRSQDALNAEIYGELTSNLFKLEKGTTSILCGYGRREHVQPAAETRLVSAQRASVAPSTRTSEFAASARDDSLDENADTMATQEPSPPSSMESNKPGFPKKILGNKLEDKHLCNCCHNILRRPFQAQCGHRFCSYCFNRAVSNGPQKCSACIKEDIFEDPTSILKQGCAFPDNAVRREVENLSAVCINESCNWKGSIKDYELTHEGKCEFMIIPCPSCKERIRFNEQERHNERECPERTLNCKYCKEPFHFKNIKAHDEICPKYPMICEGCAKKKIPREKYVDHIKFCSKFRTPCRFHVVGCDMSVEKEKIHDHERAYAYEHLNLLLHYIMGMKLQLHSEKTKVAELGRRCTELEVKSSTFENVVCVLNREVERFATTMEASNRQHKLDQDKIEALSNKVRQLERTVGLKDLTVAEMEGRLREMSATTFDGVFVWRISDFAKKRQDAIAGRAPAMFSPAFYTNKYGYKMCLRIYLNGDGTGRGSHLSLFFVVMRGLSDALLKWPFNQKVTLMLLDQSNREHIIDAFRPDVTSSSFQRPVSEMNIASGCPLFCPLSKLDAKNSYIRDDTIFIKAIVDLTGL